MRKSKVVLIDCLFPLARTLWPYLYNLTLISLKLFKLTSTSLQLDFLITKTILLTLSTRTLTWSLLGLQLALVFNLGLYLGPISSLTRPLKLNQILLSFSLLRLLDLNQLKFLILPSLDLNRVLYLRNLLGSDSFRSPSSTQKEVSLFCMFCLARSPYPSFIWMLTRILIRDCAQRLTRVATQNLTRVATRNITWVTYLSHNRALTRVVPDRVNPALPDRLPGRITLPDLFPIRLLPTRSYLATLPNFLTRLGNTSLPPTAYPTLLNHLSRPGTLQLTLPENCLISIPCWLRLIFGR
jgi:hypothetical protein